MKTAPKRWSPEEEASLTQAFQAGAAIATLATAHGRSVGAITSRLQALDLLHYGPYTPLINTPDATEAMPENAGQAWTEPTIAQLLIAHHSGTSPTEQRENVVRLAAELGRTPRGLALKLVQLGVITPTLNPTPHPVAKPASKPKTSVPKALTPSTKSVKITVTPEFQTALQSLQAGENLLILGSAGTGKSTFLKWLRKNLEGKKRLAVLAPTGMAALNIGGQTLHSFFGLKPQLLSGEKHDWHQPRNPKMFANLDLIIIDEISMVRADIFSAIDRFLRKFGPAPKQPFGGVQVLLMGDLCQLPPVVRRDESAYFEENFGTPFFFSTPAWHQGEFYILPFTHIFRQTDSHFISLLNAIRLGQVSSQQLAELNQRVNPTPPPEAVVLAARNATVDTINQAAMAKLPGLGRTYTAQITGDADPAAFTTPAELTLKVGARVMFTRNDSLASRWVNGSLAEVTRCEDNAVTVRMPDGETHLIEPVKWEATRYRFSETEQAPVASVAGTFTQIPLTLAWALTIHKAQGQTLASCVIDLADGGTFAEGQLYVALSRARSLSSLYLTQPIQARHIRTHPAVIDFYQQLT